MLGRMDYSENFYALYYSIFGKKVRDNNGKVIPVSSTQALAEFGLLKARPDIPRKKKGGLLSDELVEEINIRYHAEELGIEVLGKMYGVSKATIYKCIKEPRQRGWHVVKNKGFKKKGE